MIVDRASIVSLSLQEESTLHRMDGHAGSDREGAHSSSGYSSHRGAQGELGWVSGKFTVDSSME